MKRLITKFVILAVCSATWALAQNEKAPNLKFSHKRGFYDAPFELSITTKETSAQIRFTTDGTPPTRSATAYSKPIPISKTSVIRAAAFKPNSEKTKVETQTYIFPRDVITQSNDGLPPEGFPYSWGENKVDFGMDPRVVNDPRYRDSITGDLKSLPSFSLVMKLEDLFGSERGIYANARSDGREAERPCSLELIHPGAGDGFQIDCGIRIRGGFSRMGMNPKHAFRFFFRKEYGDGKLKHPLFGPNAAQTFDNFDLRCSQNYSWSLGGDANGVFLRDQFSRDTQLAMGHPAARGDFYHLYINGQYWGLYNTCERPEASYGASYFGGAKEDYDALKIPGGFAFGGGGGQRRESPFPTDGNIDAWRRLYDIAKAGLTNDEAYQRILGKNPDGTRNPNDEVLLDPTNLIDYMLIIFYGGNLDAPVSKFGANGFPNNWYGMRNRKGADGFRFFIWDAEHTLLDLHEDRMGPFPTGERFEQSNPQWLWQQCLDNAEFRMLVADRVHRHFFNDGALTAKSATARFLARKKEIERAVVCESARWGDVQGGFGFRPPRPQGPNGGPPAPLTRDVEWKNAIDRIVNDYFPKRGQVVLDQLWGQGLWPDLAAPSFVQHGGSVPSGFKLSMLTPAGTAYFTLDGTDPRSLGGKLSPKAKAYEAPVEIKENVTIKARVLLNNDWSPLNEATFKVTPKA